MAGKQPNNSRPHCRRLVGAFALDAAPTALARLLEPALTVWDNVESHRWLDDTLGYRVE